MNVVEVARGIHRVAAPLGERYVCTCVVQGKRAALVVDTGIASTPHSVLAAAFAAIGLDPSSIRYVVGTHADVDHVGGNGPLREMAPNAAFICHRDDRRLIENIEAMISERYGEFAIDHEVEDPPAVTEWVRESGLTTPIDLVVSGGETIALDDDLELELLHTPGHTRGHLSLYHAASRTAIISDAVLWRGVTGADGAIALAPTYRHVDAYERSIQFLQQLPIDTLVTGHYPLYRGDEVDAFLGESQVFVSRVELGLREELRAAGAPRTSRDLLGALGPVVGEWPTGANDSFVYPLVGHLERLAQQGVIEAGRQDGLVTWAWRAR